MSNMPNTRLLGCFIVAAKRQADRYVSTTHSETRDAEEKIALHAFVKEKESRYGTVIRCARVRKADD